MPRIGFNSCAARERYYGGGVKPPEPSGDLGPGSYTTPAPKPTRPVYAPFNTTQNREPVTKSNGVPGPGTYSGLPTHQWDSGGGRNAFRSTLDRFRGSSSTTTPGPGTYKTEGLDRFAREVMSVKKPAKRPGGAGGTGGPADVRMEWVRLPTAPSIPTSAQSYGYEEGEHGELVRQQPLARGYTGLGGDTVSPLDYNPRIDFTRPTGGKPLQFSKYSGRKDPAAASRVRQARPGHGDFGIMETPEQQEESGPSEGFLKSLHQFKRRSAAFCSTTKRPSAAGESSKEVRPGPGTYQLPGAIHVGPRKKRTHQNFGTSSKRFVSGPREQYRLYGGPGPGAYNQPRSDFEYDRRTEALRNLVRNPTAPAAAFESTAARFEERRSEAAAAAAPGSYDLPDFSVELERKRRMASRVAVFGSTAKRFESSRPRSAEPEGSGGRTDLSSALQQQPALGGDKGAARKSKSATTIGHFGRFAGGGWHMGKVKGRDLARESAAFASETQRTASNSDTTVPAPGTYDTREKWDSKKCPVSMGRGAERFVRAPDEFERNRGPGSYQLPPSIQPKPSNRRQVMVSGSKRFGPDLDQFAEKPPGPGAYDVEPFFGSMIKPTYNVAIAEQCGAL